MRPQKGDNINTPHGEAIILGFERFTPEGYSAPMADTYNGDERIVCKLAPKHTANEYYNEHNYALYTHEYEALNQ